MGNDLDNIQIKQLLNTNLDHYHYTKLLSDESTVMAFQKGNKQAYNTETHRHLSTQMRYVHQHQNSGNWE
jgi:hypothetical protein